MRTIDSWGNATTKCDTTAYENWPPTNPQAFGGILVGREPAWKGIIPCGASSFRALYNKLDESRLRVWNRRPFGAAPAWLDGRIY
jgi:hypothetical protein